MPYLVTFQLDAFNGTRDVEESLADLSAMLDCLIAIDTTYLRHHPQTPLLYASGVRYQDEPIGAEFWRDIPTVLRYGEGDCLPVSTLVLRDDYTFAPIISLKPGDVIMEDGQTTIVQECAITGEKPVLAFGLDNGCVLRASPDHRLFTAEDREVRAEDVRVGAQLRCPTRPFPMSASPHLVDERLHSVDAAWLVGTFIADGWYDHNRFSISGFDEKPKRRKAEQKKRVLELCEQAGIHSRWASKAITVNDAALTDVMRTCGSHAPMKRLPTMAWSKEQVPALIEGLQTDCSTATSGTLTYGTTSPMLALQLRVLHRMLDQSVHIREWSAERHKGLGTNPMFRVGIRRHADEDTCAAWKTRAEQYRTSVRVRSITEQEPELCADITTSTGRFYLPESDTIVHNCEDLACWLIAEKRVRFGLPARPIILPQLKPNGRYLYHIKVATPDVPGGVDDPSRRLGMKA